MSICIYLFNASYVKHIELLKKIALYKNKVIINISINGGVRLMGFASFVSSMSSISAFTGIGHTIKCKDNKLFSLCLLENMHHID